MTAAEGKNITSSPNFKPQFGNQEHIDAVAVSAALDALVAYCEKHGVDLDDVIPEKKCPNCEGDGYWVCAECDAEHECEDCDESGYVSVELDDLDAEEIATALEEAKAIVGERGHLGDTEVA